MKTRNSVIQKIKQFGVAALISAAFLGGAGAMSAQAQSGYWGQRYRAPQYGYRNNWQAGQVAQQARQQGFHDGAIRGRYDRASGRRTPNPVGHGAYQHGLNGWQRGWGLPGVYQQNYRQGFVQGYNRAFYGGF